VQFHDALDRKPDRTTNMPLGISHVGLRAGVLTSALACVGALMTHAQEGKIKALYVTSSFPTDTMPIDVILEHHLKTLGGPNVELKAVVFDNRPPWLNTADVYVNAASEMQHRGLKKLQEGEVSEKLPHVTVKTMDYAGIDDLAFLPPVFDVHFADGVQKNLRQMFGTSGEHAQILSNFFAMTHFMKECMRPEHDNVDLCLYFDPDMLMYRNNTGILELATATFESNPELVVVSPPFGCYKEKFWRMDPATGECPSRSFIVSSRHVVAQRRRLVAKMPIKLQPGGPMGIGKPYWEMTMSDVLGRAERGQILCGQEFFIAHPPSRYQPKNKTMPLKNLLKLLVPESAARESCSPPGECSFEAVAVLGTQELVRRFEAGMLVANKKTLLNKGCGCCADMMPSSERISAGQAFYEPRWDAAESDVFRTEANDAAFDWVVKCKQ
jgi:hypothetical protein